MASTQMYVTKTIFVTKTKQWVLNKLHIGPVGVYSTVTIRKKFSTAVLKVFYLSPSWSRSRFSRLLYPDPKDFPPKSEKQVSFSHHPGKEVLSQTCF